MGASPLSHCTSVVAKGIGTAVHIAPALGGPCSDSGSDYALVLRVLGAPIEASLGASLSGFSAGDELGLEKLETVPGLEPLGFRFRERVRSSWPSSYRFQSAKRVWRANVVGNAGKRPCVLHIAITPEARTLENVELDVADAGDAVVYASRFNLHMEQQAKADGGDVPPSLRVAAPVACSVIQSSFPGMIPLGTPCTLTPYPLDEVQKFVFDGTEDFVEMPQAYFHYAAFASNGKHMVCDVQGGELENGDFLLIDPCMLRSELPKVGDVVQAVAVNALAAPTDAPVAGPTPERFDMLHPRCAQVCRSFDPQRRSVKKNVGACGMMGGACGLGR